MGQGKHVMEIWTRQQFRLPGIQPLITEFNKLAIDHSEYRGSEYGEE